MLGRLLIAFALLCSTTAASAQVVDKIGVGDFRSIDTRGNVQLFIAQSDGEPTLTVEYHNVLQSAFKFKVRAGVLYIDVPSGLLDGGGFVKVVATMGRLERIKSEGATIECLTPIKGEYLEYTSEGSVNIAMLNVEVDRLTVKTAGKSDVMVTGNAEQVNLSSRMGSRIDAFRLITQNAIVEAFDASEIYVCPSESLKAKASFGGSIYYMGTPKVEPKVSLWGGVILIERSKYKPIFTEHAGNSSQQTKKEEVNEEYAAKQVSDPATAKKEKTVTKPIEEKKVEHKIEKKQGPIKPKAIVTQPQNSTESDGDFF